MAIIKLNGANGISGIVPSASAINDGTSLKSKVAFHRWKLNATYTASSGVNVITATFNEQFAVGTSMSYSSGIWTFPYTGKWQIIGNVVGTSASSSSYRGILVQTTTNNSNYTTQVSGYTGQDATHYYMSAYYSTFFDVTDVANCKVRFASEMASSGNISLETWYEFYYLGDT
jgi:hypothetical protein